MENLDSLAPHFRLAKERWVDAPALSEHYQSVLESYGGNSYGLMATIKSFIECVCLTILGEFGKSSPSATPTTTELLVEALRCLGLQNTRGASKVDKLLSAHNKMADALSDIRNEDCPLAHGKDGFLDTLTNNERRAFLITADTLLALLLSALEGKEPDLEYTREPYERFEYLHDRIDRNIVADATTEEDGDRQLVVVTLRTGSLQEGFELRIEPSRLLYAIDRTAYVEFLSSSAAPVPSDMTSDEAKETSDVSIDLRRAPDPEPAVAESVSSYDGVLTRLKEGFEQYLRSVGLIGTDGSGQQLRDSLLAAAESHLGLDWTAREPLVSAMKVALRRTLVRFGIDRRKAESNADQLVSWFKVEAAELRGAADRSMTGGVSGDRSGEQPSPA
jgi:hypothetical protein